MHHSDARRQEIAETNVLCIGAIAGSPLSAAKPSRTKANGSVPFRRVLPGCRVPLGLECQYCRPPAHSRCAHTSRTFSFWRAFKRYRFPSDSFSRFQAFKATSVRTGGEAFALGNLQILERSSTRCHSLFRPSDCSRTLSVAFGRFPSLSVAFCRKPK